jgi:hypothetical protein
MEWRYSDGWDSEWPDDVEREEEGNNSDCQQGFSERLPLRLWKGFAAIGAYSDMGWQGTVTGRASGNCGCEESG